MYLGGVFVCIDPLALRALPLYFAAQNTGGECEMYIPFASAPMLFKMPRPVTGYGKIGRASCRERV